MTKLTNEMLEEEIRGKFEHLKTLEPGSEVYSKVVDDLSHLYKLKLEEDSLKSEDLFKNNQTKGVSIDRCFKVGIDAAGIIIPLIFYAKWMKRGFEFEETGTFTSTTFRGLFGKFRTTK